MFSILSLTYRISKVFTILYLLCLCGNREYPDSFQNNRVGSSLKWVPKCLFLAKLEWKSIALSYKLSLTCGGNVNYYKSVHHPIPTRGNMEHPGNFQNKSVSSPFNWLSRGEEGLFLKGARRGATLWDYPQEHLVAMRDEKVSPFVKFERILSLLCFLLDSLTNKHCRTWSSMTNLWIRSRTYQK